MAGSDLEVGNTGSAQTGMLPGTGGKLYGRLGGTEAGVGHQGGWLVNTADSVGCLNGMTSRGNSVNGDLDTTVEARSTLDIDPSTMFEDLDVGMVGASGSEQLAAVCSLRSVHLA